MSLTFMYAPPFLTKGDDEVSLYKKLLKNMKTRVGISTKTEDILFIGKDVDKKLVWLVKGDMNSGLIHSIKHIYPKYYDLNLMKRDHHALRDMLIENFQIYYLQSIRTMFLERTKESGVECYFFISKDFEIVVNKDDGYIVTITKISEKTFKEKLLQMCNINKEKNEAKCDYTYIGGNLSVLTNGEGRTIYCNSKTGAITILTEANEKGTIIVGTDGNDVTQDTAEKASIKKVKNKRSKKSK